MNYFAKIADNHIVLTTFAKKASSYMFDRVADIPQKFDMDMDRSKSIAQKIQFSIKDFFSKCDQIRNNCF